MCPDNGLCKLAVFFSRLTVSPISSQGDLPWLDAKKSPTCLKVLVTFVIA